MKLSHLKDGPIRRGQKLLAIDPGTTESAFVILDDGKPNGFGKVANDALLDSIEVTFPSVGVRQVVIEQVASYGMAVGQEVFETVHWSGRFHESARRAGLPVTRVKRLPVKMHHCHKANARDANIRQAIIDRFGGQDAAIGRKKAPGPLYGVSGDVWAALALALYYADTTLTPSDAGPHARGG